MPINYYCAIAMNGSDIEMNKNQLQLPVIDNESSAPSSPVEGQMYYDTTTNVMYYRNNSGWVEMDGTGSGVSSFTNTNGTYISATTANSAATGAVTVGTIDLSAANGTDTSGRFLSKDNVWSTIPGGYTSWTINGDSNTGTNTVSNGETVDIEGGKGITTSAANRTLTVDFTPNEFNTVTIASNDKVVITDTSDSDNPKTALVSDIINAGVSSFTNSNGTYISATTQNSAATGAVSVGTIDLSAVNGTSTTATRFLSQDNTWDVPSYTTNTNTNTTYTLPTTNGNNPDIVLTGSDSSTDIVNMNGTSTTVSVTGSSTSTLTFDLVDSPTIAASLTVTDDLNVGDDIALTGGSSKITGLVTAQITNDTDAANKKYVDDLVAGGLTFKDGFNANTGAIDGGGNLTTGGSRVAVAVGDYYVVTTAGDFYGSVALDVGDSVIAKQAAAAGTSDINDWVIIQGDEGVISLALATGASTGAPLTANATSGAITLTSRAYAGASNAGYVPTGGDASTFLRGDGTWVTPTDSTPVDTVASASPGLSTGVPIVVTPVTGNVKIQSMAYSGSTKVGHVPTGGSGTTFLRGDGAWATPTDTTTNNYVDSLSWNTGNGVLTVGRSGLSDLTVDLDGRYITANQTITLSGDVSGSGTTSITTTIGAAKVLGSMLNDDVISSQTELTSTPAATDELLISDAGVLKKVDVSLLADQMFKQNTFAITITGFGTVNHNLGTYDVIVQLYDATSYETIYACVDRNTINQIAISGNSFPSSSIRVLVTAIQS